jgi:hypothetical protein
MTTALIAVGAVVVSALVAGQLLVQRLVASRVERHLTRGGGSARVMIRSFPAVRLLAGEGSRITIRGDGLHLPLAGQGEDVFGRLEGFGVVDVRLKDMTVGPLSVGYFRMDRDGGGPYRLHATASGAVGDLVRVGTARLGVAGSVLGLLGGAATAAVPARRTVPLQLDMELAAGDQLRILSGGATVAGYPTGPLGQAMAESVLASL